MNRRQWIKSMAYVSAVAVTLASPLRLLAALRDGFKATSLEGALAEVLHGLPLEESYQIKFKIPDIAENGAVVPVTISTDIADVTAISIVIDNNPNPLTSRFDISADALADVSTRVKMGGSSMVRVYVETPTKVYTTAKEVKVTIGGCGG
jgi:sulfur-oxidizing protein SoxY